MNIHGLGEVLEFLSKFSRKFKFIHNRLSLALKVQFLQNLFLVSHYFVVDIDCVEITDNVEVICLMVPTDPAASQLAAAQRFD